MPCCCGWRQDHVHVATWCRLLLSCATTAAAVSNCYWLIIAHPLWRFYTHESSLLILSSSCVHFLSNYSACSYGLALLVHWAIFYTCTCITLLRIDKSALLSVETTVLLESGVLHDSQELKCSIIKVCCSNVQFFVREYHSYMFKTYAKDFASEMTSRRPTCLEEREYYRLLDEREKRLCRQKRMGETARSWSSEAYSSYLNHVEKQVNGDVVWLLCQNVCTCTCRCSNVLKRSRN